MPCDHIYGIRATWVVYMIWSFWTRREHPEASLLISPIFDFYLFSDFPSVWEIHIDWWGEDSEILSLQFINTNSFTKIINSIVYTFLLMLYIRLWRDRSNPTVYAIPPFHLNRSSTLFQIHAPPFHLTTGKRLIPAK